MINDSYKTAEQSPCTPTTGSENAVRAHAAPGRRVRTSGTSRSNGKARIIGSRSIATRIV